MSVVGAGVLALAPVSLPSLLILAGALHWRVLLALGVLTSGVSILAGLTAMALRF